MNALSAELAALDSQPQTPALTARREALNAQVSRLTGMTSPTLTGDAQIDAANARKFLADAGAYVQGVPGFYKDAASIPADATRDAAGFLGRVGSGLSARATAAGDVARDYYNAFTADPVDELMEAEGLQASISHSGGAQGALGANNAQAGQAAGRAAAHGLLTATSGRPELRAAHSEELLSKSVDVYNLSDESRSTLFDPRRRADLAEYARMARASGSEMDRSAVAKIVTGADKDPGLYAAAVHLANYDAETT